MITSIVLNVRVVDGRIACAKQFAYMFCGRRWMHCASIQHTLTSITRANLSFGICVLSDWAGLHFKLHRTLVECCLPYARCAQALDIDRYSYCCEHCSLKKRVCLSLPPPLPPHLSLPFIFMFDFIHFIYLMQMRNLVFIIQKANKHPRVDLRQCQTQHTCVRRRNVMKILPEIQ